MDLLEREQCFTDLAKWRHAAADRAGCIVLVGGEAGIGKSSLLQEFANRQHDSRVLWGGCDALFTPRPLAPLHDIARQTQGALLAAVNDGANRDLAFTAALDELERASALVVLEDMHWADEATLDLLKYLGRRIHLTHSMLAITYRNDEVGPQHPLRFVIGDLPRAHTHRLSLSPLSESAVVQLAKQAGRASEGLHKVTAGNPLFVTEVLAAIDGAVPASVRDVVLGRTARLSPAARDIAELVCVVPGKTEAWLLQQAARSDEAAIEACLAIGMLRNEDASLAFRHEIARCALEDSLAQSRLQNLHSSVLAVLSARSGIPAARLAHHAHGARNAEAVLQYVPLAAAQAAAVGAHREAASHYQVVLGYAQNLVPAQRAHLEEQLSYECYLTGQYERAIAAQSAALNIWRNSAQRAKEGNSLCWLSRLSWFVGKNAEAAQYGIDAVATLESLPPSAELATAYSYRADLAMEGHDGDAAIELTQHAIAIAEACANDEIIAHALTTRGTMRLIRGDNLGWADLNRSLDLALAGRFQDEIARTYTHLAAMAVSGRQYAEAARHFRAGVAYCEEHDLDTRYLLAYRARMRFEQSNWNEASDDIEAVLRHPLTTSVSRIPALRILGHIRIRRGDPGANAPLDEARALGGPTPDLQRLGTLAAVYAEAAWLAGDRQGVVREVEPAYRLVIPQRDPRMKGELAAWLWRAGALAEHPRDVAEPYALEISGDWQGAARAWQDLGCPYEHASMLAWYGTEHEQREALAIFERLEASPAALALRMQMRAQGIRSVPRGKRTSTQRHPHGLTRREAEILALLSKGLRNAAIAKRLFISTKTVDHHVSAILTKLGVLSRAEAIAITHRQSGESGADKSA
jgi:DNA-binding CsgD family transcriptional regulator